MLRDPYPVTIDDHNLILIQFNLFNLFNFSTYSVFCEFISFNIPTEQSGVNILPHSQNLVMEKISAVKNRDKNSSCPSKKKG